MRIGDRDTPIKSSPRLQRGRKGAAEQRGAAPAFLGAAVLRRGRGHPRYANAYTAFQPSCEASSRRPAGNPTPTGLGGQDESDQANSAVGNHGRSPGTFGGRRLVARWVTTCGTLVLPAAGGKPDPVRSRKSRYLKKRGEGNDGFRIITKIGLTPRAKKTEVDRDKGWSHTKGMVFEYLNMLESEGR